MKEEKIRILVLEDQAEMRNALAEALEDEGYEVTVASRGAEAVAMASASPYDLLVTDIRMDGMDGLEALRRVRQEQPEIHSMVVTGYSTEEDSIRAIRLGAGDYLKKPFKLSDFLERVSRLVAERRAQIERLESEQGLRETTLCLGWGLAEGLDADACRAGRLAAWLSREVGLADQEPMAAAVAASLAASGKAPPALARLGQLSKPMERLLRQYDNWKKAPLGARVVSLAVAAASRWEQLEDDPSVSRAELLEAEQPGRHDPFLLQLVNRFPDSGGDFLAERLDRAPPRERGLLSLALTLEESGDLAGAERAYQLITGPERREAVNAWLGLARLARRQEQLETAHQAVETAVQLARRHGPGASGEALLEAGLMGLAWGLPSAAPMLEEAENLLARVGSQTGRARAQLARFSLDQVEPEVAYEALKTLGNPGNFAEFVGAAHWLFPILLEARARQPHALFDGALGRLVREVPRVLEGALARGLSEPAREVALNLVASTGLMSLKPAVTRLLADPSPALRERAAELLNRLADHDGPPCLMLYSMGTFEVMLGSERVKESGWKTAKVKYLLAYLASRGGRAVADDRLIELFWPGPAAKGKRNLNTAVSRLRKCLHPADWDGELDYVLRSTGQLMMNPQLARWHDLEELEKAASRAAQLEAAGQPTEAIAQHARVAELYRGPYLEECYMDWASAYRTRLEQTAMLSFQKLADHYLESQPQQALEYAQRQLEVDPCSQEAYANTIQANIKLGAYQEAVRAFKTCEKMLDRELGMEPSVELFRLYQMALVSQSGGLIG